MYQKPNQELKYLNRESAHAWHTFQVIPTGISKRLTGLRTVDNKVPKMQIEDIYPETVDVLRTTKLIGKQTPTFGEVSCAIKASRKDREQLVEKQKRNQEIFMYWV